MSGQGRQNESSFCLNDTISMHNHKFGYDWATSPHTFKTAEEEITRRRFALYKLNTHTRTTNHDADLRPM